jgi:hypothetical protein
MSTYNLGYLDQYLKDHVADLQREAQHDRLVDLALGPGRPVRALIADWLYAVAERVEGAPRQRPAESSA